MNASTCPERTNGAPHDEAGRDPSRELTEALARVRHLYCEDSPRDLLVEALDSLIECARAHFDDDGRRLKGRNGARQGDGAQMHGNIVEYILLLRQYVDRFDKFGLLPDLHYIDCWLKVALSKESPPPMMPYDNRQRRLVHMAASLPTP